MRRGRRDGQHLARPARLAHARRAAPLARDDEQRRAVGAAEHAREAAAVELDPVEDLAALADADAAPVGHVGVPDGTLGVDADAVRDAVAEVGPDAPAREAAVGRDVQRRQAAAVGLGQDQRRRRRAVIAIPLGNATPSATRAPPRRA